MYRQCRTGEDDYMSEIRMQVCYFDLFCCSSIIRLHFAITISQVSRSYNGIIGIEKLFGFNSKPTADPLFEQKQMRGVASLHT